jgi:hypothetical protein
MGCKAFDLKAMIAYGGWVAEVGVISYLTSHFVLPILEAFSSPDAFKV